MSGSLAQTLRELGQRGILVIAAERGDITELACTMDECLCPRGRGYFDRKLHPLSDWAPSVDHFPILKKDGGKLVLGNADSRTDSATGSTMPRNTESNTPKTAQRGSAGTT